MIARKRSPIPPLAEDYSREAAAKRIDVAGAATGARPAHIGSYSLDPAVVAGNVENYIGAAQVPIGIAGPQLVNGEHALGGVLRAAGDDREDAGRQLQPGHDAAACHGRRHAHERLGRNRPALRGFNSEKEASWTG